MNDGTIERRNESGAAARNEWPRREAVERAKEGTGSNYRIIASDRRDGSNDAADFYPTACDRFRSILPLGVSRL